jgi:hypothetical protein
MSLESRTGGTFGVEVQQAAVGDLAMARVSAPLMADVASFAA